MFVQYDEQVLEMTKGISEYEKLTEEDMYTSYEKLECENQVYLKI